MKRFKRLLPALIAVLMIMVGCDGGTGYYAPTGEFIALSRPNIKSVTVHVGDKIYGAHAARDITQTDLSGDSEQFDYAEEIDVQAHLPGRAYNQHLTLKHNGKTVHEEQAYNAATAKVKLVYGENVFEWYLNLPSDGEKALKVTFKINHTPPITLPQVLWVHYGQSVFTLSNLGVKTVVTEVEGSTFADNMTFAATVYYKNGEEKGEKIGNYDTESNMGFTLPKGVRYDDIIVELFYTPDTPEGKIPNVVGLKSQDAIEILKAHGFNYTIYWEYNNEKADIIFLQRNAGTVQEKGFTETIYASKGQEPSKPKYDTPSLPKPPAPETVVTEEFEEIENGYLITKYVNGIIAEKRYYTNNEVLIRIERYDKNGVLTETVNYDENTDDSGSGPSSSDENEPSSDTSSDDDTSSDIDPQSDSGDKSSSEDIIS